MVRFPNLLIALLILGAVGMSSGYWYSKSLSHVDPVPLVGFPESIEVEFVKWENWAQEFTAHRWIAHPSSTEQVLKLANWARRQAFTLRPSGAGHSLSPLTVQNSGRSEKIVIVDTRKHLSQMKVNKEDSSFWAQPGVKLETALKVLEENSLSLASFPTVGDITLGGGVSTGAHGVGFPLVKEKGHSYGSLANLVVSFTAVVYDPIEDAYILKDFQRSDPEASAFLVSLGRTFLTNITLRAGPLLQLHSKTQRVKAGTFFAEKEADVGSYMDYWTKKGIRRIQVLHFPLQNDTVVFYGAQVTSTKPAEATQVTKPYYNNGNILAGDTVNIWGSVGNVLLFPSPDSPKISAGAWVIITSRKNLQSTFHKFYSFFIQRVQEYKVKWGLSNVILEERVTSLDDPGDVGIAGAQSPGLSALSVIENRPDLNVALFLNVVGPTDGKEVKALWHLMTEIEGFLWGNFNTEDSKIRVEWSKNWGFTPAGPHTNGALMLNIMKTGRFSRWKESVAILRAYDPWRVFSNFFVDTILNSQI